VSNGIYHDGDVQIWTDRTDDEVRLMYTDDKGDDYDVEKMIELAKQGYEVVKDFLPNVAHCALQDYGRLNEFMIKATESFGD
jgi:hypothetical protein